MVQSSFACVVSKTSFLRYDCICASCDQDVCRQILPLQDFCRFINRNMNARYIHRKRPCPIIIIEAAGSIGLREDSCSDHNRVQPAVGQYNLTEHLLDAVAVRDVARNPDCRSAIADAAARYPDSLAMSGNDLLRGFLSGLLVKIHTYNVRALID